MRDCATTARAERVFDALGLRPELYAADPELKGRRRARDRRRAARGHQLPDLPRPAARLATHIAEPRADRAAAIDYDGLEDACADEEVWSATCRTGLSPRTMTARRTQPSQRPHRISDSQIAKTLLDYHAARAGDQGRRARPATSRRRVTRSNARLIAPGRSTSTSTLSTASILFPRPRAGDDDRSAMYLSPRGGFGSYLRRHGIFPLRLRDRHAEATGD